ncbi:MAG TPA: methionyl-tRNA formyltransferase [Kiritimatiellia bacterium]|nr:methionyl-tRNA formyltransferase [Kiritimatiellia bacterium]HRZ11005.1 methionyl-tRNA formyltransferase [Kiritimatiellia bacterium]HSA18578.1 methionyl-tRNA formyltransferase [Kiritimatiellia bacterium]
MRILFMGSGSVACPALRELAARREDAVVAVVTQPDRPSGRRRELTACPAKSLALSLGLPVREPEKVGDPSEVDALKALAPDLIVVADYGQFLRPALLALPAKGAINIHPSLLPKYRGAAPIQWAVANGETEAGVTILHVTEKMDAGDILLQEKVPIRDEHTAATLTPLLAELGATLLIRAIESIRRGEATRRPQDEALATFAPKLTKEDGRVQWTLPAEAIRNRTRGFTPWPGSFAIRPDGAGGLLRLLAVRVEPGAGEPGLVLECGPDGPLVACGENALRLLEVLPEGRKAMSGAEYARGYRLAPGLRFT